MYIKQRRRSKIKLLVKTIIGKILFSIFLMGCYYFYYKAHTIDAKQPSFLSSEQNY